MALLFLICSVLVSLANAAIDADEIKSLPGWEGPLPSRMWSGYIKVPGDRGNKFYHYWFVESENSPKTDPVALWLNGGPGSSSLIGFFTENGPFMLNDNSLPSDFKGLCHCDAHQSNMCSEFGMTCGCGLSGTHCTHDSPGTCSKPCAAAELPTPKLFHRKTGWQMAANYIFLESPAGVGFSYCDYDGCSANDTSTAIDNHNVLKGFFEGFPEYAGNDFYITGESYAGIYCPTLAEQIDKDPHNKINLKGIAVGNGCWGSKVGLCAFGTEMQRIQTAFLYGHGAISMDLKRKINADCGDPQKGPDSWGTPSKACHADLSQSNSQAGSFEIYNFYDTCYGTTGITMSAEERESHLQAVAAGAPFGDPSHVAMLGGAVNDYTCGGSRAMKVYLARSDVVEALHVRAGTKGTAYGPRDRGDLRPLYKELAQKYRVTIYSGDVDMCVPYVGTEEWTSALGFEVLEPWRPWQAGTNQNASASVCAGYVTTYKATPDLNFTFITIKGAGHMAPEFKPVPALRFIQKYFSGEPY